MLDLFISVLIVGIDVLADRVTKYKGILRNVREMLAKLVERHLKGIFVIKKIGGPGLRFKEPIKDL